MPTSKPIFRARAVAVFAAAALAFGPTLYAAKKPAKPVAATRPAGTRPATQAANFPTPAELIRQIRDKKAIEKAKVQVAVIDLSGGFDERASGPANPLGGGNDTFVSLLDRIRDAADDKDIKAVLFTLGEGTELNLAQVQEVRVAIKEVRDANKRVFAYGDSFDTQSYVLASAASDVCVLQAGELFLPGVSIESMFYRGIFDKLGVTADYVQIGEFKGAEEPYTRVEPSPQLQGELEALTGHLLDQIVRQIAQSRTLDQAAVRKLIDGALISAEAAKSAKLVDHLVDIDGLRDLMKKELGGEVNLQNDYGETEAPELDFSNPWTLLSALAEKPAVESDLPKVAVIYAQGVIVDGEGGGGGLNPLERNESEVSAESMRRSFRMALRDDKVKAVVVRVDSPGGSAMASEEMWQAMRRVAKQKPVYVSVGNMAASGGYYLASAGDEIYADPAAVVGSIGVVGGKVALAGLYEKLGIHVATISQGANADIYSSTTPWTDKQKTMIRGWMTTTYEQFTDRIKTMRGDKIKDLDKVARGRIFTAEQAKDLGMVDHLGGLDDAIAAAAAKAGLDDDEYDLKELPPAPSLRETLLGGAGGPIVKTPIKVEAPILSMFPRDLRAALGQSIALGRLMEKRPVVLMTPFVLKVR